MTEIQVNDVPGLIGAIKSLRERFGTLELWFRGEPEPAPDVRPFLHRRFSADDERKMVHRFRLGAPMRYTACPESSDLARWLCLMQHFGLPTRLLDWTESPLIAVYFALSAAGESERVVRVLAPAALNEAMGGARRVEFLNNPSVCRVLRGAFEPPEEGDPPEGTFASGSIVAVIGQEVDLRMTLQQSRFTIHGDAKPLDDLPGCEQFMARLVMPPGAKQTLDAELYLLGLRRSLVFPDLQTLAHEIRDEYLLPDHVRQSGGTVAPLPRS